MHNWNVSIATTLATSTTLAAATTSILTEVCELEEIKNTMVKVALHRKQQLQQVNNHIHGLFIDIDRQPAMPNSRNTNFAARAHHHGG